MTFDKCRCSEKFNYYNEESTWKLFSLFNVIKTMEGKVLLYDDDHDYIVEMKKNFHIMIHGNNKENIEKLEILYFGDINIDINTIKSSLKFINIAYKDSFGEEEKV